MSSAPEHVSLSDVEAALTRGDVVALQSLATAADKLVSKSAKRALHRLRARGVAIPERETASAAPATTSSTEAREPIQATTIDGDGRRAILLPLKSFRGFELHMVLVSDQSGVESLPSRQLSRRQLHTFIADLDAETREVLREISPERAVALLAAAIDLNPNSAEAARTRDLLRALPTAGAPVESAAIDPSAPETRAALRDSISLFETAALRSYLPPREVILSVGQKLEEVMLSPLLVDETQRVAQMRHALERAEADYFTPQRRQLYSARLRDAAEYFLSKGESANAAAAQAVGVALASETPIEEIPFAREMFERIFDLEAAAKAKRPSG